jgi:hypothetical protein
MVKGSCLCGGVRYEIDGEIGPMAHCYCSMCRKQHGTSLATYVGVKASDFRWVKGEELVAAYQSSPGLQRGFCRTCGSNLPVPGTAEESLFIPAGTLDDDPGVRPAAHIFVASKAPWVDINDDLPQFDEYPPGFGPDADHSAP